MNEDSMRVAQTKLRIRNAFLELYKEKRIERISIKEIMDLAGLNRGTFYVYYQDIYELLEKTEDEAMEKLKRFIGPTISHLLAGEAEICSHIPAEFFEEEYSLLNLFFGERADARLMDRLKKTAQGIAREKLHLEKELALSQAVDIEYTLEYVASAQIGLVTHWFRRGMEIPLDQLVKLVTDINFIGPLTYLQKRVAEGQVVSSHGKM